MSGIGHGHEVEVKPNDTNRIVTVIAHTGNMDQEISMSYTSCKLIGNGRFGVVFAARLLPKKGEELVEAGTPDIAIKKLLQGKRSKNRELQIMTFISHPNVVDLRAFFYSSADKKEEVYLNLVLEYMPETVYCASRRHSTSNQIMPMLQIKLYMYQLLRSLAYIHSIGICHRDIKLQNLLHDPATGILKLCDFGSAKILVAGEPNISYVTGDCRAPELLFGVTNYTTYIDIWSTGCVMAEMILGRTLFPGASGIDQLVEIFKILGTPSRDEMESINPIYMECNFPRIKSRPFATVFPPHTTSNAVALISNLLEYAPTARLNASEALTHEFFDELRAEGARLMNGKEMPALFNFTREELSINPDLIRKLVPTHAEPDLKARGVDVETFVPISLSQLRINPDASDVVL